MSYLWGDFDNFLIFVVLILCHVDVTFNISHILRNKKKSKFKFLIKHQAVPPRPSRHPAVTSCQVSSALEHWFRPITAIFPRVDVVTCWREMIRCLSVCRTSEGWGVCGVYQSCVARPPHFKGLFPMTISIVGLEPGPRTWRAENVVGN